MVRMNFFGLLTFQAPYLPWVLLGFSLLLGNSVSVDLLGMAVGHIYYFLEDVFPNQPGGKRLLQTPAFLQVRWWSWKFTLLIWNSFNRLRAHIKGERHDLKLLFRQFLTVNLKTPTIIHSRRNVQGASIGVLEVKMPVPMQMIMTQMTGKTRYINTAIHWCCKQYLKGN